MTPACHGTPPDSGNRPAGGQFSFVMWVAVLGYGWVLGIGQDGQSRQEIEWVLEAVPTPSGEDWPSSIWTAVDDSLATSDRPGAEVPAEAREDVSYEELLRRITELSGSGPPGRLARTHYRRRAVVRRAALACRPRTAETASRYWTSITSRTLALAVKTDPRT